MRKMAERIEKVQKALIRKGFKEVYARQWRQSVILEGEMDDWKQIVKAGKAAAKFGYKGVVNEIKLKGYTAPPLRVPDVQDGALEGKRPDVMIIGGGVIGCSIARELTKYNLTILLADKESDVAMHASSRNDGMIHPGIASHAGTLRGEMNVKGNAMYTQLCKELDIPFKRYGNLILYSDHVFGVAATVALAENAVENGAEVSLNTVVTGMEIDDNEICKVFTNRGTVYPRLVINAAGTFADKVAEMAGDKFFSIHPRKGELVILDKKKGHLVTRSMGLVGLDQAFADTKGGGVMRTIDGNVLVGPDAYEIPEREDFSTHRDHIDAICKKHLPLIKGFTQGDVITYFAGVRAPTYEEEFIIERSDYVPNLVHAAGIQSPGLASAPAIAERIAEITVNALKPYVDIHKNPKFNPYRRRVPHMAALSFEEKQKVIKENPDYGVIICRCEEISKGEIIDAIHSPIPATSIDALKRRVRPGMGRCQGGFCSPLVTKIICDETGMTPDMVTKSGGNSQLVLEKTHKGGDAK